MDENVQNWDILATESRKPYVISAGEGAFRMDNEHFLVMEFYGMVYRPIKPSAHTHIYALGSCKLTFEHKNSSRDLF